MIENKRVDSKHLLFNREEYASFKKYISRNADHAFDLVEDKYRELHEQLPFKAEFDRKTFLDEVISDKKVVEIFNLN